MREPARSYNHKIKVLLPEPNSAKRQQLADCLLLSLSISPAQHHRCHQPFVYFVFWKRNWKHKRSSYRTFSCLFSSPLRLCVCLAVCFLVMRGYGMKTAQQHDPPPSHPTSCGVRQPQTKKVCKLLFVFARFTYLRKAFSYSEEGEGFLLSRLTVARSQDAALSVGLHEFHACILLFSSGMITKFKAEQK